MDNYYKSNPRGSWRGRRPSRGRGFPHGSRGRFQSQNVPRCWFCGQLGHCYYNCPLNSLSLSSSHLNFRHESQAFQFPVLSTTTKMSITPTYFDKLNDDCVRLIFAEFSLQEHLLLLRAVCRRWKTLVGQICASKRSLTLFGAFADIFVLINTLSINTPCLQFSATYRENAFAIKAVGSDNDLVLSINDDLDYQNVWQFIVQQFPSVQKLVICLHGDQYNHLAKLLLLYPDLKEVVLFGSESANMSELFQQICRLKSLTVFEYYLSNNGSTNELIYLNPNLERLSLETIRNGDNVVDILRNMNPDTLTKLTLYEMDINKFSLLLKEYPAFGKNLKELSVYFVNRQLLDFISKHFRAISKLHIGHVLFGCIGIGNPDLNQTRSSTAPNSAAPSMPFATKGSSGSDKLDYGTNPDLNQTFLVGDRNPSGYAEGAIQNGAVDENLTHDDGLRSPSSGSCWSSTAPNSAAPSMPSAITSDSMQPPSIAAPTVVNLENTVQASKILSATFVKLQKIVLEISHPDSQLPIPLETLNRLTEQSYTSITLMINYCETVGYRHKKINEELVKFRADCDQMHQQVVDFQGELNKLSAMYASSRKRGAAQARQIDILQAKIQLLNQKSTNLSDNSVTSASPPLDSADYLYL